MVINKDNIEEYLLLSVDGELSEAEEAILFDFINNQPQYQALLDAFLQTRLDDTPIVFEDKESLLKPEVTALPIRKKKTAWAIAAGIAALLGAGVMLKLITGTKDMQPTVASVSQPKQPAGTQPAKALATVTQATQSVPPAPVAAVPLKAMKRQPVAAVAAAQPRTVADQLDALPVAAYSKLDLDAPAPKVAAQLQRTVLVADEPAPEAPGWSPINKEKLELINDLVAQVEILKDDLHEKAKSLKITALAIRLGGKEFTIGK